MNNLNKIKITLIFILLFGIQFLYAQNVIKIVKTVDNIKFLNKNSNLRLVLDRENYILGTYDDVDELNSLGIKYEILTSDIQSEPLYLIFTERSKDLKTEPYFGEIVLDEDIRIEKIYDYNSDLVIDGIKCIPLQITQYNYHNKNAKKLKPASLIDNEIIEISNMINPDSIASYIQSLEDFETRYYHHSNRKQVAEWIADKFFSFGYTSVRIDSFYVNSQNFWQYNVECIAQGTHFTDSYVMIGAHHDSMNSSYATSMISAPGADDNASGVAAVLETARVLVESNFLPKTNIRFMTYAMEEPGMFGSYYDAGYFVDSVSNINAMLNCDMLGYTETSDWSYYLSTYTGAEYLTNLCLSIGNLYEMNVVTTTQYSHASDGYPYHVRGVPTIFFMEYDFNPYYHSSDELLIHVDVNYAAQFTKLISTTALYISQVPDNPSDISIINAGDGETVLLNWTCLNIEGVDYEVKVTNTSNGISDLYFTNQNNLQITNLQEGTEYKFEFYSILELYQSRGEKIFFTPSSVPEIIKNFTHLPFTDHVEFHWDLNTEADIQGYRIYKKLTDNENFILIADLPHPENSFIDYDLQNIDWYSYIIRAYDVDFNESMDSIIITTRRITLDNGILILDYTLNSETNLLFPSKPLVDQFYREILANYDFIEIELDDNYNLIVEEIGIYSTVLIHKNSFNTVRNNKLQDVLESYINLGGNIIYTANDPLFYLNQVYASYPIDFNYDDFTYNYFGINQVDNNNIARFAQANPQSWNNLPVLTVDSTKVIPFLNNHLFKIEAFTVDNTLPVEILYTYDSQSDNSSQAIFDDYPIAIYKEINNAKVILTSIPLYFINQIEAQQFISNVLSTFGEETNINDKTIVSQINNLNFHNYPNPFNPSTKINFSLPQNDLVKLTIYNTKGQVVKTYREQIYNKGTNYIIWDGKNNHNNQVSSGIYFYRLKTKSGVIETKKMLLIK